LDPFSKELTRRNDGYFMQDDVTANKSLLALGEEFGETVADNSLYVCHISSVNFACQHA
jgi:hypothetical protein